MSVRPAEAPAAYYPAFLNLLARCVVVVGGGAIATEKVRGLLPCGPAPLVVVAPEASFEIREAAKRGALEWRRRAFEPADLHGADYVFAATDDRAVNAAVAAVARDRHLPVLAVDDVPNCDFIAPAVVRRGDLVVAISTNGRSPAMARRTRQWLDRALPQHWGALLGVAARARVRLGPRRRLVPADRWQEALDAADALVQHATLAEAEAALLDLLLTDPEAVEEAA